MEVSSLGIMTADITRKFKETKSKHQHNNFLSLSIVLPYRSESELAGVTNSEIWLPATILQDARDGKTKNRDSANGNWPDSAGLPCNEFTIIATTEAGGTGVVRFVCGQLFEVLQLRLRGIRREN